MEEIFLSKQQVLFLILRGDERPPRERLGHNDGDRILPMIGHNDGVRILPMIYIASRNSSSTHHRSRPLSNNTSSIRVDEFHILT